MQLHLLVALVFVMVQSNWGKTLRLGLDVSQYAPGYPHGTLTNQDPIVIPAEFVQPQKTEALINNTMVAGGMLYRFFRAIYRAGTVVFSYMPAIG